jgi:hypothetical protein
MTPEEKARQDIDRQLAQCGWLVQSRDEMNISAAPRGWLVQSRDEMNISAVPRIAVREFPMLTGEPTIFCSWARERSGWSGRSHRVIRLSAPESTSCLEES